MRRLALAFLLLTTGAAHAELPFDKELAKQQAAKP